MQLIQEKVSQATEILDELGVDLWLTFVRESVLNGDPVLPLIGPEVTWQSAFILCRDGDHQAIVGRYDVDSVKMLGVYPTVTGYDESIREPLREALLSRNPARIAVNYSETDVAADGLSHGMFRVLLDHLDDSGLARRLMSAEQIIAKLRGRKTATEVARVQAAVDVTEELFNEIEAYAEPGMTARQVYDFVQGRIADLGLGYAWDRAHNPIVTCGPMTSVGHAPPADAKIVHGGMFHIDLGVKLDDYCSDIQRIWYVPAAGESQPPADVQHAFDAVYAAIKAGERALRPGVPGWQVDKAARDSLTAAGYDEYKHAFGHLLGRVAHDGATVLGPRWPKYRGVCELLVEADNIFTLELHVVLPERGVVSLEEDVLVTAQGVHYLSKPQTALRILR